jgi:hypothetical protein
MTEEQINKEAREHCTRNGLDQANFLSYVAGAQMVNHELECMRATFKEHVRTLDAMATDNENLERTIENMKDVHLVETLKLKEDNRNLLIFVDKRYKEAMRLARNMQEEYLNALRAFFKDKSEHADLFNYCEGLNKAVDEFNVFYQKNIETYA